MDGHIDATQNGNIICLVVAQVVDSCLEGSGTKRHQRFLGRNIGRKKAHQLGIFLGVNIQIVKQFLVKLLDLVTVIF
jgi:hypothetical protein